MHNEMKQVELVAARGWMLAGVTNHARQRVNDRRLPWDAVECAMAYGRALYARGAVIFAIGRKEVVRHLQRRVDLRAYEGVEVVCSHDGAIITAYRNRNLHDLRGLRDHRGVRCGRRFWALAAQESPVAETVF